jgi:hypothetical protein
VSADGANFNRNLNSKLGGLMIIRWLT